MCRVASTFVIVASLSLAFTPIASAADIAKPIYKAPPAPVTTPAPVYNWTGFYVGGNLGGAWGNIDVTDVATGATISPNSTGFTGGGQFGFDYRYGSWVVGIRNVIDGTTLSKDATYVGPTFSGTISAHVNWYDALTGRVGYLVQPNLLLYGQGGGAWAQWDVSFNNAAGTQGGQFSGTKTGWTAGGGVEWMFEPHWSAFVEYNFLGFGTYSNAVTTCIGATCGTFSGNANIQNVLVGVNYKF